MINTWMAKMQIKLFPITEPLTFKKLISWDFNSGLLKTPIRG